MKVITVTIFFTAATFGLKAQNASSESYYPLTKGLSKTLTWYKSKYREVIKDTVKLNGKFYTQVSQIFPPNKSINIYVRESNDTIYFYNQKKEQENPFFGIAPNIGQKIGNGTVKKIDAKLRTPEGKLTELLQVEMNYSNGQQDIRYYKKGLGLVAVKNEKGLICYYIPD